MTFLKAARFFFTLSIILMIVSAILLVVPGPKLSIEFTGGTLMEVRLPDGKTKEDLAAALKDYVPVKDGKPLGNIAMSKTKSGDMFMRMRDVSNAEHIAMNQYLQKKFGSVKELQFTTIGPTVGASLKQRAVWALLIASGAIIVYLTFAFRKVPRKLSPWKFGVIAVVTLLHDLLITTGIFIVIGRYSSFEVDTLFITALLTILGYSVNDTIIIFDRIRDNVINEARKEDFPMVAEMSLQQSAMRSCITSFCTLIMLSSLFLLGAESIRWFVLTLIIGIILGTYSSIFLATPLLVYWRKKS